MTPAGITETDLEMVARAGDWLDDLGVAEVTDEDRALARACAIVEAERRELEWSVFEQLLRFVVDGRLVPPAAEPERSRVLVGVIALGWHYPVPIGRADEASGCQP